MAGNFHYDRKKKKHYDRKKRYSRLSVGCAVLVITTRKKNRYSRLSGGLCCCVSFWFLREIGSFFVVAGKFYSEKKDTVICLLGAQFWQLRPEKKKDTVVCLAGCAVVLIFVVAGNFD